MLCRNEEKETIKGNLLDDIGTELEPEDWSGHRGWKPFQKSVRCSCSTVWEKGN